jgi:hypothetical protein
MAILVLYGHFSANIRQNMPSAFSHTVARLLPLDYDYDFFHRNISSWKKAQEVEG